MERTVGLSPDFVYINPIGFLALTLWNWGVYFSPLARAQYAARHNGHAPQIAVADLAFSMHALVISIITLLQVFYYAHRARSDAKGHAVDERTRLIPLPGQVEQHTAFTKASTENPLRPSKLCQVIITGIVMASIISGAFVWADKAQWLDWLYFASSVKLFVSAIKYIPQIHLNWRLKSVEGFSIGNIIMVRLAFPNGR
jgi:cystinosin